MKSTREDFPIENATGDFQIETYSEDSSARLDLFSTSPTLLPDLCLPSSFHCIHNAPYFAFSRGGKRYGVVQGCCNHWDCQKCGLQVAKQHYGRIVEGARALAKESDLWFVTVTCRGKEVSEAESFKMYLTWTSKFLDACYTRCQRVTKQHPQRENWSYVQVTEKQKRGHPHSHILSTFAPDDIRTEKYGKWIIHPDGSRTWNVVDRLRSNWIQAQVVRSSLGEQYDISKVRTVEGAARYIAKYMFKPTQFTTKFPTHWKRVRYAQSFPQLPDKKTDAFVLLSDADWHHLATLAVVVDAPEGDEFERASYELHDHDTIVVKAKKLTNIDNSGTLISALASLSV